MSTPTVTTTDAPDVAPIVGKPGWATSEGQLSAAATALLALLGSLIGVYYPHLLPAFEKYGTVAESVIVLGYSVSRAITKLGVVRGLATQHAALSAAGREIVREVETVDPSVKPAIDELAAKVEVLSAAGQQAVATDPALEARLSAIESWAHLTPATGTATPAPV